MTKFNPYRFAKYYLATSVKEGVEGNLMFTVQGALERAWLHGGNRKLSNKALAYYRAAVHPYYSERTWLVNTVLDGNSPDDQDMQDYRHRWMDHMAEQWDKGEIK